MMISKSIMFKCRLLLAISRPSGRAFHGLRVHGRHSVASSGQQTRSQMTATKERQSLPHWETTPKDLKQAIREIKPAIRARIEASGRTVPEVFAIMERRVAEKVAKIKSEKERGETVWAVVDYSDIENGTVSQETMAKIRDRGCIVVRGHFSREQGLAWDQEMVDYLERNKFFENYRGPGDDFFSSVGSKPEIYPIYWSKPQMEGRQHPRMTRVQSFLNSFWKHTSNGVQWFDPHWDCLYPDRMRRRPPGTTSPGLGTHIDTGTLDLWMTSDNQKSFRHLYDGTVEQYDPWDATHRTLGSPYPASTQTSGFRTYQGWTALCDMDNDQGVLHTVPIPEAKAYLLLRPLMPDVSDDDMCGVTVGKTFPINNEWHPLLLEALSGIPSVRAGDTVWWHCDTIHSVAAVTDQKGWANVMYIPVAPNCPRNRRYTPHIRQAFLTGSSPTDFPAEHYERDWTGRFTEDMLNENGRRGLGL